MNWIFQQPIYTFLGQAHQKYHKHLVCHLSLPVDPSVTYKTVKTVFHNSVNMYHAIYEIIFWTFTSLNLSVKNLLTLLVRLTYNPFRLYQLDLNFCLLLLKSFLLYVYLHIWFHDFILSYHFLWYAFYFQVTLTIIRMDKFLFTYLRTNAVAIMNYNFLFTV